MKFRDRAHLCVHVCIEKNFDLWSLPYNTCAHGDLLWI
jgi:hypothetical protein